MPSPSIVLLRTQSDARLVSLAREGHERAFEAIVERYRRQLLRSCRRVLPEARAEDALQQALVAAWRGLERGDEVRELRPWLHRIAHNTSLNLLRQSGYDYDELQESLRIADATEDELERRAVVRQTLQGLAALPERQREALLAIAVEGRSQDEVASELGLTAGGGAPARPPRADRAAHRRDRGRAAAGGELGGRGRAPGGPRRPHRRALGRRGGRRLRGAREGRDGGRARGRSRGRARAGGEARRRASRFPPPSPPPRRPAPRARRRRRGPVVTTPGRTRAVAPPVGTHPSAPRREPEHRAPVATTAPRTTDPPRRAGRRRPLGRRRFVRRRPRALGRGRREPQRPVQRVRRRRRQLETDGTSGSGTEGSGVELGDRSGSSRRSGSSGSGSGSGVSGGGDDGELATPVPSPAPSTDDGAEPESDSSGPGSGGGEAPDGD